MVYSKCGHPIKPCDTFRAPRCVQEKDMPERCLVCRAGGELAKVLKLMDERRQAEERILQGLRMQALSCVGIFGGMCWSSVESIDERVELVKRRWSFAVDALCHDFEEKEGREQW
ncbi:hypothetical protein B0O99DRAFT_503067 [Bisporella sp. PMI_857]|nr:hypothetical protein B0O99DRAFT_503067 [Bisporella sp. PMI_857]